MSTNRGYVNIWGEECIFDHSRARKVSTHGDEVVRNNTSGVNTRENGLYYNLGAEIWIAIGNLDLVNLFLEKSRSVVSFSDETRHCLFIAFW